jgi:hypothetical protein
MSLRSEAKLESAKTKGTAARFFDKSTISMLHWTARINIHAKNTAQLSKESKTVATSSHEKQIHIDKTKKKAQRHRGKRYSITT